MRQLLPAIFLAAAVPLTAQVGGVSREQMWYAPTAEDWAKPVLIQWQRSWQDAVNVSRETGKPILVCVNMDGEIASEHYAGIRYRMPEIAKLYEPYVCVMASVYRHNPRDYDEQGRRIECPRFHGVTCGEHIAMEPIVFEKFLDGVRVAPRHIMVELDGSETYDIYYAFDTDSVFQAIEDGIANRQAPQPTVVRGDRTILEKVQSYDSNDRAAVEAAYAEGSAELRKQLVAEAKKHWKYGHADLMRQAVFGLDEDAAATARQGLAKMEVPEAVDVINEAMRAPMPEAEKEALIGALERLGKESPRARMFAVVNRGLGTSSQAIDAEAWRGAEYPAPDAGALAGAIDAAADKAKEKTPEMRLDAAIASLQMAVDPSTAGVLGASAGTRSRYAKLMLEDARREADAAEKAGASGWKLESTQALLAYYGGDRRAAAERAVKALPFMPKGANDWQAISTLALYVDARQRAIFRKVRAKEEWPGEWLTDLQTAYSILARHPLHTAQQALTQHDFLIVLGAKNPADKVLQDGLQRFADHPGLHDRLRSRVLNERGVDALEPTYAAMLARPNVSPTLPWYAGYTSMVAGEFYRRNSQNKKALASYDRAIELFEKSIETNPISKDNADHYIAMSLGGQARVAFEQQEWKASLDYILASLERREAAAANLDGLNVSTVDTAKLLLSRLKEAEKAEWAAQLDTALKSIDPELLKLPAFEKAPPGARGAGRGGRRTQGSGQGGNRRRR